MTSLHVATEHDETEDVDAKSSDTDVEQEIDLLDLFRCDQPSDSVS